MKRLLIPFILLMACLGLFGCNESFTAGAVAGAATMGKLQEDALKAQDTFLTAIKELNATTATLNDKTGIAEDLLLVKPETIEAIESLKGREKDPLTWIAALSIVANTFWGGKTFGSRKGE